MKDLDAGRLDEPGIDLGQVRNEGAVSGRRLEAVDVEVARAGAGLVAALVDLDAPLRGIPLSPLVLWFISGVVMMYTGGIPQLTPAARIEHPAALDLSRMRLTPAAAAERGRVSRPPARAKLLSVMGRPTYRFDGVSVFAHTGERLSPIGPHEAREVAHRFTGAPLSATAHDGTGGSAGSVDADRTQFLPAHKLHVSDAAGTELYVEQKTAEVAMVTTRRSRALGIDPAGAADRHVG